MVSHSGDDSAEDPPVPIPNTEVKLCYARSSWVNAPQDTVVAGFQLKEPVFVMKTGFFLHFFAVLSKIKQYSLSPIFSCFWLKFNKKSRYFAYFSLSVWY